MGNELFDIVNPTYLHSLHDIFTDKFRCNSTILDKNCQPITPESRLCDFCQEIRKTKSGFKICRDSDRRGMKLACERYEKLKRPEPVFYKCNHGLIDFCAPIVVGDEILGYLMSGQFRNASKDTSKVPPTISPDIETLRAQAKINDEYVDEDALYNLYNQTISFDSKQFELFYNDFKNLTDSLNAFIAKVRGLHKPEKAYKFMKEATGIKNVEDSIN